MGKLKDKLSDIDNSEKKPFLTFTVAILTIFFAYLAASSCCHLLTRLIKNGF